MIIYESIKKEFIDDVFNHRIDNKVKEALLNKAGIKPSPSEITSFINSLHQMKSVLETSEIDDVTGIAIEYKIPNNSKRVDFIISGYDKDEQPNIIIVELKQWSSVESMEYRDGVVKTFVGQSLREVTHPSYQAWSYSVLIKEYNENIYNHDIELYPCAYLHNYEKKEENDPLFASQYEFYLKQAQPFVKGDAQRLRDFIKRYIAKGDNKELIYHIDKGKIKPSKSLQDKIKSMVLGNQEFIMIDSQKVIFEKIKAYAKASFNKAKKAVFIIEGGPGTGKSVLAIQSLSYLLSNDKTCMYVTKNAAPKNVMKRKLSEGSEYKKVYIDMLMKGSSSFVHSKSNEINCVLVDEAHRLILRSQYAKGGENQIKEIINASLFTVFFIDETQRVTFSDIGSIAEIRKWAKHHDATVYHDVLDSQFRCNGSDGYIAWLDNLLEIRETANETFSNDYDYDFKVFDDPILLKEAINKKNKANNKSRLVAGYCWDWDKVNRANPNHFDIVLNDDFKMSWNLSNTDTYAIDDHSIDQIGCIHTVQGLEFDYVGVIIGEDLRFEDNRIITDYNKRAKTDKSLNGLKMRLKDPNLKDEALKKADEIIRNTYKTLMTRGLKGCYVYCVDSELNEYMKSQFSL